jgi:hypothetical protein
LDRHSNQRHALNESALQEACHNPALSLVMICYNKVLTCTLLQAPIAVSEIDQ